MRRPAYVLRENKRNIFPRRMVFWDTETIPEDVVINGDRFRVHKLRLWTVVYDELDSEGHVVYRDVARGKTSEEFWRWVEKYVKPRVPLYMFAHNAVFDFVVVDGFQYLDKMGFMLKKVAEKGRVFFLDFVKPDKKGRNLRVRVINSGNFYPASIEELGRLMQFEKLKMPDYDNMNDEDWFVYCQRDTEVLEKAMLAWINFLRDNDLGNFAPTLAGQALNAFKHRFMKQEIYIHTNDALAAFERDGYYGGRTEAFWIGKVEEDVYVMDVNSMYPYVMKYYPVPTRYIEYRDKAGREVEYYLNEMMKGHVLMMARVHLKTDVPIYAYRKDDKVMFPIGQFMTVLSTPELMEAYRRGHILKVYEYAVYEGGRIFADYVDYFYRKKSESTGINRLIYKLFLNSLYGKFGQRSAKWQKVAYAGDFAFKSWTVVEEDGSRYTYRQIGRLVEKSLKVMGEARESFVAIAAHVTAYARVYLWHLIETVLNAGGRVYYCDTDSLFVNERGMRALVEAGYYDETELGKLDMKKVTGLEIWGAKDYMYVDVNTGRLIKKLKGVPKDAREVENKFEVEMWPKIGTLVRLGFDGYVNRFVYKTLKRIYDKGVVTSTGQVVPHVLQYNVEEVGA